MQTSDSLDDDGFKRAETTTWTRFKTLIKMSIPLSLANMLIVFIFSSNIIFIGMKNNAEMLAGLGVGNMMQNIIALSVAQGLNGAIDTLASQAYGAGDLRLCGIYLNRGRFIVICYLVLIFPLVLYTEEVMVFLGQDPLVSKYAGVYTISTMPAITLMGLLDSQARLMNSLGYTRVQMTAGIISFVAHCSSLYYFVYVQDMDIEGVAIASTVSVSIGYGINLVYCQVASEELNQTQIFPGKETFENLGQQLHLGFHSCMLLCLEWWAFELMTLICGYIGVYEQTSQIIYFNLLMIPFNITMGMRYPSGALIGKAIGRGDEADGRAYFNLSVKMALVLSCFMNLLIYLNIEQIMPLWTQHKHVIEASLKVAWLAILSDVFDVFQAFQRGPINALGIQAKCSKLNIFAYYPMNLGLCYLFAFHWGYGYLGIWIAITSAQVFVAVGYYVMIQTYDWQEAILASQERQNKDRKDAIE